MAKQLIGWLPFGSDDEDVVFSMDLKSEASITDLVTAGTLDADTAEYPASGTNSFDSTLGFKPGTSGGYKIELLDADAALLEWQGQVSFQVRRDYICNDASATVTAYSQGTTHRAADEVIAFAYPAAPAIGGRHQLAKVDVGGDDLTFNGYWRVSGSTIDESYLQQKYPGSFIAGPYLHTDAFEDEWVTVNIGWHGQTMYYSLDGAIAHKMNRPIPDGSEWKYIVLGNQEGASLFYNDYIRNFQIAKRAPIFASHPMLRNVRVISDSIFDANNGSSDYRNCAPIYSMVRSAESRGYRLGEVTIDENAGSGWTFAGVNPSLDTVTDTAIAAKPSFIYMVGGHNDCQNEVAAATTFAAIQDCIERAMGVNSNPSTTIQGVVIATISSFKGASAWQTTAIKAVRDELNVLINTIESWWDSTYPGLAGRVRVVDTYDAWGGENTPDRYFIGSLSGAYDNVHDAGLGNRKRATLYGEMMMSMLSLGQKP